MDISALKPESVLGSGTASITLAATAAETKNKRAETFALKLRFVRDPFSDDMPSPHGPSNVITTTIGNYAHQKELSFARAIANRYPDYFAQLDAHDYCIGRSIYDALYLSIAGEPLMREVTLSRSAYRMADGTMEAIIGRSKIGQHRDTAVLSPGQIFSAIAQLSYAVQILENEEYVHGDIRASNIGFRHTNISRIVLNGNRIPTYGYRWLLFDYSEATCDKYDFIFKTKYGTEHYDVILATTMEDKLHKNERELGGMIARANHEGKLDAFRDYLCVPIHSTASVRINRIAYFLWRILFASESAKFLSNDTSLTIRPLVPVSNIINLLRTSGPMGAINVAAKLIEMVG